MMRSVVLALLLAVVKTGTATAGDDGYLELLRSDVRAEKRVLVTEHMQLTDKEAEAFWPVYDKYEHELKKINNQRLELIRDYAENWYHLSDAKAQAIAKGALSLGIKKAFLRQSYYRKFEHALSSKRAAQFLQLEQMIDLLVDVQIAAELPLID